MHRFIQLLPDVAHAYREMYSIVRSRGVDLLVERAHSVEPYGDQGEEGLVYVRKSDAPAAIHGLRSDVSISIGLNISNHGFDTDPDDPMVWEEKAEETARCFAHCDVQCYLADTSELLFLSVRFDPLHGSGWNALANEVQEQKCKRAIHALEVIAQRFGFRNDSILLKSDTAHELVSALATCFVELSKEQ